MPGQRNGGPKATLAIDPEKLGELVRESIECKEPRALGSDSLRNIAADDARPTTQIDPTAMRALIDDAVPPIEDFARPKRSAQAIAPLEKPAVPATPPASSTRALVVVLALVCVLALVGWLR